MAEYLTSPLTVTERFAVFPVHGVREDGACECRQGAACRSAGKHPMTRNGHKDASRDRYQVQAWIDRLGETNWGVACGRHHVVLDVDAGRGGYESLEELENLRGHLGPLPSTLRARSGGGGMHLYFAAPVAPVRNAVDWRPGIDVRADGGYLVAPPSMHASGNRYKWLNWGEHGVLPTLPADVACDIASRATRGGGMSGGTSGGSDLLATALLRVQGFRAGSRDAGFHALAWRLARNHYPHFAVAVGVLREVWLRTEQPPGDEFAWEQAEAKLDRAWEQVGPQVLAGQSWAQSIRGGRR